MHAYSRSLFHSVVSAVCVGSIHVGVAQGATNEAPAQPIKGAWVQLPSKPNGSGVVLAHRGPNQPLDVGQPSLVELRFEGSPGARLVLKAPTGVTVRLADGSALPDEMEVPAAGLTLRVQPLTQGLHYLVVVTTRGARQSVHAVPLKVGSAAPQLKRDGQVTTTPSGEAVISLPARP